MSESLVELESVKGLISLQHKKAILNYFGYIRTLEYKSHYVQYNQAQQFRGDFYGIQKKLAIPENTWFANLLANDMRSPSEYNGEAGLLYTVDSSLIRKLLENTPVDITIDPFKELYT